MINRQSFKVSIPYQAIYVIYYLWAKMGCFRVLFHLRLTFLLIVIIIRPFSCFYNKIKYFTMCDNKLVLFRIYLATAAHEYIFFASTMVIIR